MKSTQRVFNSVKNKNNLVMVPSSPRKRMLPFFIEFVKFVTGFAVIVAVALITLHVASAAMAN